MVDKNNLVAKYVSEVAKLAKTGITTEHSFRKDLCELLAALMPGLTPINEPKRQACGAPDFIIIDKNKLPVMFVETKDLGDNDLDGVKPTGNKEQFDRYKAAFDTIIFTDFQDFHFYRNHGQRIGTVRIADWDGEKILPKNENFTEFVNMMDESACGKPQRIDSAKRLAELMAGKARMIQRISEAYLQPIVKEYDSATAGAMLVSTPLLDMMLGFRKVLMPDVGSEQFSDIFAQTLTYGMFAARLHDPTPEDFSRYEAMGRIPNSNPFLKQLFQYVANNLEEELEWIVDDLADLFKAADVNKIMKDYSESTGTSDPMVHFYEDFLREYDAGLRKDRGVWYTPIQIVRFIVSTVDWALKSRFGLEDGLADSSKTQIEVEEATTHGKKIAHKVKKTVHRVQVLDPAAGTGTFLAETIRQVRAKFDGNEGVWPEYVSNNLLPRLNGFEILMASYTMAHVKIDFALKTSGMTLNGKERFRVFLTDSLTEWHDELPGGLFASALAAEQQGADEVKRDIPVMVVMGNPPYSGISQNNGAWITKLVEDYKVEPGGVMRLQERKNWLNDDYVKFIRLAEYYVEKNGNGIVAYITPHGFLDNPTFRGMRWHLMRTFDEIWVLNLHGNSNQHEVAPDDVEDECVFNIKQGVSISLFVKFERRQKKSCRIFYSDLWGKKSEKLAVLETVKMESIKWKELSPSEPMLFFIPRDTTVGAEWESGFSIAELMSVNCTGIVSMGDSFSIAFDRSTLEKRVEIVNMGNLTENAIKKMFSLGKNYASFIIKNLPLPATQSLVPYAYRPFDMRWINYSPKTIWRPRSNVMVHFCRGKNIGLVCKRGLPFDSPSGFITEALADNRYWTCSGTKGTDSVFPLWLYEENLGKGEKRANMDVAIVAKISEAIGDEASPEDIFAYIYGMLHTPQYRRKFREFLRSDFPRIPYPKDVAQFNAVMKIGNSLIETHLMRDAAPGLSETRARFPKTGGNQVEEVRFEEGRVFINTVQFFDNVPTIAWEMQIGGYKPAEKWLKDRNGRKLSGDDIKHYQRIIIALVKTAEAVENLEAIFDE